jgi:uridine kinase
MPWQSVSLGKAALLNGLLAAKADVQYRPAERSAASETVGQTSTLLVELTVNMQPSRTTDLVVELVAAFPARPLVIALDGPSAAGTSTLGVELGARLSASVVAGDDFYRDMPEAQRWALTAAQGVEEYFDWQRLRHEVLEPLRAGRPARYRRYSWLPEGGLDERWVTVDTTPIIVLEGVYAARPQLRDLVDMAVLVETPAEERQRRLIVRGGGNDAWWPRWGAAEAHYFTKICPRQSFDLVIPGA